MADEVWASNGACSEEGFVTSQYVVDPGAVPYSEQAFKAMITSGGPNVAVENLLMALHETPPGS